MLRFAGEHHSPFFRRCMHPAHGTFTQWSQWACRSAACPAVVVEQRWRDHGLEWVECEVRSQSRHHAGIFRTRIEQQETTPEVDHATRAELSWPYPQPLPWRDLSPAAAASRWSASMREPGDPSSPTVPAAITRHDRALLQAMGGVYARLEGAGISFWFRCHSRAGGNLPLCGRGIPAFAGMTLWGSGENGGWTKLRYPHPASP